MTAQEDNPFRKGERSPNLVDPLEGHLKDSGKRCQVLWTRTVAVRTEKRGHSRDVSPQRNHRLGVMEGQGDRDGDKAPEVVAWVCGEMVNQDREHRLSVGRMMSGGR